MVKVYVFGTEDGRWSKV